MFISVKSSGYRGGEQFAFGKYLIVIDDGGRGLAAIARNVRLRQFGHWMSARVKIAGFNIVVSGAYGGDGLPYHFTQYFVDVAGEQKACYTTPAERQYLFDNFVRLPKPLEDEFWAGGGWNTSGKEEPAMRAWATENIKELSKAIKNYQGVQV